MGVYDVIFISRLGDVPPVGRASFPKGCPTPKIAFVFCGGKEALPDANKRQPGEVLSFVLDAIRAYDAKTICTEKPPQNLGSDDQ
jgi:hypothetical protein